MSDLDKSSVKRLSLNEMEQWKQKAKALDKAVQWMTGRLDSEALIVVYQILTDRK